MDIQIPSDSFGFDDCPDELDYETLTWAQVPRRPRAATALPRQDNASFPRKLTSKLFVGPAKRLQDCGIAGAEEDEVCVCV